jgi:alkylation response protein AidB-like acyl-CoA dehydrogenase
MTMDFDEILGRAQKAAITLRERAVDIEQARHLPADVVALLKDAGVFRMAMPAAWGGPELTSAQQTEVIEALAVGDASAAWCAMIGMDSGIYSGYLDDAVAREMFPRLDMVTAGWIHPEGRAERVPGGYRVTGSWKFGSGITHADWVAAGCVVHEDGAPVPGSWRVVLAKPEQYEIHDTWYTTGLAGSGSRDYAVRDLFVPEEHTFSFAEPVRPGPLHALPDTILRKMSGVPLGLARAALDHARSLAATRVDRATGTPWPALHRVQTTIALSELELAAARAAVYDSLDRLWERLAAGEQPSAELKARASLARYGAFRAARTIVQRLYDLVGGAAIYRRSSPVDRWLRDANTICQHAVAQDSILALTGELLLGGRPESPFL